MVYLLSFAVSYHSSFSALLGLCSREHLPKDKKRKIGISIAIYTETERDEIRIKSDFISEFKSAILSQFRERIFQILILNNHRSQKVREAAK